MKNNFKMNFRNQLYALFPLLFFTILFIVGLFILYYKLDLSDNKIIAILIFLYSIFAVPVIIIHFEYIFHDYNVSFYIDLINKTVYYNKGKKRYTFTFNEIEKIYFFGETKDFNNLTTQNHSFYYCEIRDIEPLIVTCLVIKDIESIIPNINIIKIRRLFPSIMFEDLIEKKKKN